MIYKFFDANGVEWNYNSEEGRIYVLDAEDGIEVNGTIQNGYYFPYLEQALEFLMYDGYMFKEKAV